MPRRIRAALAMLVALVAAADLAAQSLSLVGRPFEDVVRYLASQDPKVRVEAMRTLGATNRQVMGSVVVEALVVLGEAEAGRQGRGVLVLLFQERIDERGERGRNHGPSPRIGWSS